MVFPHTKEFRETLNDYDSFSKLATFFVEKAVEEERQESGEEVSRLLNSALTLLVVDAVNYVFRIAESPIERIFINSLVLNFIKASPLELVVMPGVNDVTRRIDEFRRFDTYVSEFVGWYEKQNQSLDGVREYLSDQTTQCKITETEAFGISEHILLYHQLNLRGSLHLILQPRIDEVLVEGRRVRPDLMFWVPNKPDYNIIVECDGYKYHSDKTAFKRDRRRDRTLKYHGYDILRFSGSEIFLDPVAASTELARFLFKQRDE